MIKIAGAYSLIIGLAIVGLWTVLLVSGQVPELITEPKSIYFHIVAELVMAGLLIVSGIGILSNKKWSMNLYKVSAGLLIYSVINSSGFYAQNGNLIMVAMFMVLLIGTVMILMQLWNSN